MAVTNGSRKVTSGGQSSSRNASGSVLDDAVYDKLLSSEDKKPIKITVRKHSQISQSMPGNWQESKASKPRPRVPTHQSRGDDDSTPGPTLVNAIDGKIAATFPSGRPFDETSEMVQCKHCKKPVYKSAAASHIRDCLRKKQEKLQKKKEAKEAKDAALRKERNGGISPEPTGEDGSKSQGSARKGDNDADGLSGAKKTSKKRKAEEDAKGPNAKKKKKDEPKAKTAKPKGPVDVEKQCGVILSNGAMCARSLTCKSHSMGAKRAVPGRSMKYDVLLAQYQRKNQAKLHRAAMDANAPLDDEFEPQGPVDSDEERDAVMKGINSYYRLDNFTGGRTMGAPIEPYGHVPLRRRYNYIRLKGAIQQAIGGVHGAKLFATPVSLNTGLFGGLAGRAGVVSAEPTGTGEHFDSSRRSSLAPSGSGNAAAAGAAAGRTALTPAG